MAFTAQNSFTINSTTTPALSATVPATITFGYAGNNTAIRYAYLQVQNGASFDVFVRTDGQAAAADGGEFNILIPAGQTTIVGNLLPLWTQSATVIPLAQSGTPTGVGGFGDTPLGSSLYGQQANPGTSVSIIAVGASTPAAHSDVTITGTL